MIDYTEIERPAEPHSSDDYPDQWQEVLAWEIARAEKAEERVKELEDAIAAALRIKELWGPSIIGDVMENRALYIMLTKFEELVK